MEIAENIELNAKGQPRKRGAPRTAWKPGVSANPAGRPAAGFQSFKDRLARWLETKTLKEIQAIVEDEKKFNKLLSVDAMVARRIHQACKASGGADFQMILDRLLGKPAITADLQVTHALASRLDAAEQLLLSSPVIEQITETE